MTTNKPEYKVVIQLSGNDLLQQKATISQVKNILKALENTRIEIVAHSLGIELFVNSSPFKKKLYDLVQKNVTFLVCQNALDAQNVTVDTLFPFTGVVPSAVAHLIIRQAEGWSYLKIG